MIGTLATNKREVTVVGAGIAGMLAAHALDKDGYRVTLVEEKERGGGLISTSRSEFGIAESAAHSLIATRAVRDLCQELGVELITPRPESKAKFIVRDGKLRRFPLSILEIAQIMKRATFAKSKADGNESLEAWAQQHLGKTALDYLLTPFVRGIYGAQPVELGVMAAYPSLNVPAGKTLLGSLVGRKRKQPSEREKKARVAPKAGMGELVSKLEQQLERRLGNRFRKNEKIAGVPDAPNVILATPAHAASSILKDVDPVLADQLKTVNYTPIVSVTAFVDRDALEHPVHGTGVLMPSCEERRSLGILFNSSSFDYRVTDDTRIASFTVMMGGTLQRQWLTSSDEEIRQAIKLELFEVLQIREPLAIKIHRWPMALPQYSPGLPLVWQTARSSWCAQPGRILFGNYTGQISLRGMIESAARIVPESSEPNL